MNEAMVVTEILGPPEIPKVPMGRPKRFNKGNAEKILRDLREALLTWASIESVCAKIGMSPATYYRLKAAGLAEFEKLEELEDGELYEQSMDEALALDFYICASTSLAQIEQEALKQIRLDKTGSSYYMLDRRYTRTWGKRNGELKTDGDAQMTLALGWGDLEPKDGPFEPEFTPDE